MKTREGPPPRGQGEQLSWSGLTLTTLHEWCKATNIPCGWLLRVFNMLVAWQMEPSAFCNMSNKKPSSHNKQVSLMHAVAVCCRARFRTRGVK